MQNKINQIYQKIDTIEILAKKFYPVWFFTNERTTGFLCNLRGLKIEKVFGIGGGGDFAFNCLSLIDGILEINVCDARQLASITIDLKKNLIQKSSFEEILEVFKNFNKNNEESVFLKIKEGLTPESKIIFDTIFKKCGQKNFLECIKKSGYWYKYSFWQKNTDYLLYLNKNEYEKLKKRIEHLNIYYGDFNDNLKIFKNNYYDLIYVSNIFDSDKFCSVKNLYLQTIKEKLKNDGLLLVVAQNNSKKIIKIIENQGFKIYLKETHRFSIIASLRGHYCYSFLLFKKFD